jgi:hypothetical protein
MVNKRRRNDGRRLKTGESLSTDKLYVEWQDPATAATKNRHRAWVCSALSFAVSLGLYPQNGSDFEPERRDFFGGLAAGVEFDDPQPYPS